MASGSKRFNEAPIHESGKFMVLFPHRQREACFNEAPIHESGKLQAKVNNPPQGLTLQ